jgi:protein involved in polysaccharide export with SLBB domain
VIKGDHAQNVAVEVHDIVFVPSLETVGNKYFMLGEVRNPGLLVSQEELTLLEAISRSGSTTTAAQTKHVFVVRPTSQGNSDIMDIAFEDLYKQGDATRNIPLKSGDIVYIPRNLRTRISDVLAAVNPILTFVRDAAFLGEILTRTNR